MESKSARECLLQIHDLVGRPGACDNRTDSEIAACTIDGIISLRMQIAEQEVEMFDLLAELADSQTRRLSVGFEQNENVQKIIGMGQRAVPLLIKRLEKEDSWWILTALYSLVKNAPTTPEMAGKYYEQKAAWLNWGKNKTPEIPAIILQEDSFNLTELLAKIPAGVNYSNVVIGGKIRDYGEYGDTCATVEVRVLKNAK